VKRKDRIVSVRMDEDTYLRLKSLADRSGASLSTVIRRHLDPGTTTTYASGNGTSSLTSPATFFWRAA